MSEFTDAPSKPDEWEVRITVYRNGLKVNISDALGNSPASALYAAHNDLERWADEHPASRERELTPEQDEQMRRGYDTQPEQFPGES